MEKKVELKQMVQLNNKPAAICRSSVEPERLMILSGGQNIPILRKEIESFCLSLREVAQETI